MSRIAAPATNRVEPRGILYLAPVKHEPGLDGLRAVAVIAVVLFHAELPWASGGFLGVSLFFTLSGFLITSLLLAEREQSGAISLRHFYGRRVRRLLPAAYACLFGVAVCGAWWSVDQQADLPGDLVASVGNVANWRFALSSTSYQDIFFSDPSPVAHFWSLAIEEQIYLLLPVVVLVALRRGHRFLAMTTGALLIASVLATLVTADRDLVYNGTHTRAAELLVGVGLAQWMFHRRRRAVVPAAVTGLARLRWLPGAMAGGAFAVLIGVTSLDQSWIYEGGLPAVALLSAIVIWAVVDGRFPGTLLSARPLVAIGTVSYGIYLFHWPVFLFLDHARTGLDGAALFAIRCLVTAFLTVASYVLLEQPVRVRRVLSADRRMVPAMVLGGVAVIAAAFVVVPTAEPTPSQQLMSLGEDSVVEFATSGASGAPDGEPTPAPTHPIGADAEPTPLAAAAPAVPIVPIGVAVLGTDALAVTALDGLDVDVIDGIRPECPLTVTAMPGCAPLVDQVRQLLDADVPDVFVFATGVAELDASLADRLGAETDEQLLALGASQEAAAAAVADAIDLAAGAGAEVIWYTAVHPISDYYRQFLGISVIRPEMRTLHAPHFELAAEVRSVVASMRCVAPDVEPAALRVLVIGDSTSIYLAQALHTAAEGRLSVLWAGANGCPFAPVDALRGAPNVAWSTESCDPYAAKVPPLLESFDPDVLFVMTGPTELMEQRRPGDSDGQIAGDATFETARNATLDELLALVGPDLPVLFADLPVIHAGRFSSEESTSPERLAAVNAQLHHWAATRPQVDVFAYRATLESAEASRGSLRADGAHPDIEPLEELARQTYVDQLLDQVQVMRSRLGVS